MSSWIPPENKEDESSHDPGVKEREITEEREFSDRVGNYDWIDYVVLAVLASIPAAFLTMILLWELFPEYQDTAGAIVREIIDLLPLIVAALPW